MFFHHLFVLFLSAKYFADVAQQIVNEYPELAKIGGGALLRVLACKPHAFKTKLSTTETLRKN